MRPVWRGGGDEGRDELCGLQGHSPEAVAWHAGGDEAAAARPSEGTPRLHDLRGSGAGGAQALRPLSGRQSGSPYQGPGTLAGDWALRRLRSHTEARYQALQYLPGTWKDAPGGESDEGFLSLRRV